MQQGCYKYDVQEAGLKDEGERRLTMATDEHPQTS